MVSDQEFRQNLANPTFRQRCLKLTLKSILYLLCKFTLASEYLLMLFWL